MAGVFGLIAGAARLGWGAAKVGAAVAVERKVEELLFGKDESAKQGAKSHLLGAAAKGFGSLGKLAAKKMVQQAARSTHKLQGAPQAAHEAAESTRQTGDAVQASLRQAARLATKDFSKAIQALTALDDSVVRKLEDLSDLFDRLAYRAKSAGGQGGGGSSAGGGEDDEDDDDKEKKDDKGGFSWRDFLLGRASKRGGKTGRLGRLFGRFGKLGSKLAGGLRWGGKALGPLAGGLAGYDEFKDSQGQGDGLATSIGKGAAVGGATWAGTALGAVIGQAVIPIPFVGATIGGLIGGSLFGLAAKWFMSDPNVISLGGDLATLTFEVEKDIEFEIERDIIFEAPVIILGGGGAGDEGGGGATTGDFLGDNLGQTSTGLSFEDQMMAQATGGGGRHGRGGGAVADGGIGESEAAGSMKGNSYLAKERAWQGQALKDDPNLRLQIAALATLEDPSHPEAVIESLLNRSNYLKSRGKSGDLKRLIHGGFYGPVNRGKLAAAMEALKRNPERLKRFNEAIDRALHGSNQTKGFTDQGSAGDPNFGVGPHVRMPSGEEYNDYGGGPGGHAGARAYREESQRKAREADEEDRKREQEQQNKAAQPATPATPPAKPEVTPSETPSGGPQNGLRNGRIVITPSGTPDQSPPSASPEPAPPSQPIDPSSMAPPQNKSGDGEAKNETGLKTSQSSDTGTTSADDGGDDEAKPKRQSFKEAVNTKAAA